MAPPDSTNDPPPPPDDSFFAALAHRDYRFMWGASLSAGAAAWALIVARGWLVYEMSDSALLIGVVTFAAMIPRVTVTPFTGYLSDRFERKSVLALMFGASAVQNLVLAALVVPRLDRGVAPDRPLFRRRVGQGGADAGRAGTDPEPGATQATPQCHSAEPGRKQRLSPAWPRGHRAAPGDDRCRGRQCRRRLLPVFRILRGQRRADVADEDSLRLE